MTRAPEVFDPEVVLSAYAPDDFTPDQWKMLRWCTTKDACDTYIERFKGTPEEDFISVVMLIKSHILTGSKLDPFEQLCHDRVVMYEHARREAEKRKYVATGTRRAARNRGWRGALESIVGKPLTDEDSVGFKALKELGRLDASYEAFVLANPSKFSEKTVKNARTRLDRVGYIT